MSSFRILYTLEIGYKRDISEQFHFQRKFRRLCVCDVEQQPKTIFRVELVYNMYPKTENPSRLVCTHNQSTKEKKPMDNGQNVENIIQ